MAIRRCPYCKAIIDESQKYCNNCGTQLLFPEDENVEEDIKGERLVDDDFKDAEEEFEDSLEPSEDEEEAPREEIDLGDVLEGGGKFPGEAEVDKAGVEKSEVSETGLDKIPDWRKPDFEPEPESKPESVPEPKSEVVPESGPESFFEPEKDRVSEPVLEPESGLKAETIFDLEQEPEIKPSAAPEPEPEPEHKSKPRSRRKPELPPPPPPAPQPVSLPDLESPAKSDKDVKSEILVESEPEAEIPPASLSEPEAKPDAEPEPDLEAEFDQLVPKPEIDEREITGLFIEPSNRDNDSEQIPEAEEDNGAEFSDRRDSEDTKEEIARLIAVLEKKQQQKKTALSPDEDFLLAPLKKADEVPSWGELGPDTSSREIVDDEAEDMPGPVSFAAGDTMDFQEEVMKRAKKSPLQPPTIGIPETPSKKEMPFRLDEEEEKPIILPVDVDEELAAEGSRPSMEDQAVPGDAPPRLRLGFLRRTKALLFDLIFIAVLWFAAIGMASLMMNVGVIDLITGSAVSLGLFFGVLFAGYIFLFFFFLGETLGGRLSAPKT